MIETFAAGIQEKILEVLRNAESSIIIMSAWLTDEVIINALLRKKRMHPEISIKILVTNDHTNRTYFVKHMQDFAKAGIKADLYFKRQLMHNKIILCDGHTYITGSYNLSNNAKSNKENLLIVKGERLCKYYQRIYLSLSDRDYIDQNIVLLAKYPEFSRGLLSTYYPFTKTELKKHQNKILLGECFTYDIGDYNKAYYSPGLIFNTSIKHVKFNSSDFFEDDYFCCEFDLPVSREVISTWMESQSQNHIINSFYGHEDLYHLINDELDLASDQLKIYFERKIENCFPTKEMEEKIKKGIDIIIENDLWKNQFEPFISKETMNRIFNDLPILEHDQKYTL